MVRIVATAIMAAGLASAATLTGRIVEDHSGSPAPSADVRVYRAGLRGLAAHLETDADGRFQAPGLAEGDYRIEVSKPNHLGATLRVRLNSTEPSQLFLRLVRCGVISGQVRDGQGQPVRGASVFAMAKLPGTGVLRPDFGPGRYAAADARGQFRLFNLPPGEYTVAATYGASTLNVGGMGSGVRSGTVGSGVLFYPNNSQPQYLRVSGGEDFRNVDFAILPAALYNVSGKAELSGKKGSIWLALATVDQPTLATAVAFTQPDGAFQLSGIAPGSYYLFASGPSVARGRRGAVLPEEPVFARRRIDVGVTNIEGLAIVPENGRSVTFALRAAAEGTAAACSAAQLVLSPLEDWAAELDRRASISLEKETKLSSLAPTRYSVSVTGLGDNCYATATPVLDLSGSNDPGLVIIPIASAGAIRGVLDTRAQRPSDFAIVLLADLVDSALPVQVVFPDADSRFTFTGLKPGRYRIGAQPATEKLPSRWVSGSGAMIEVDVAGGGPTEMKLAVPAPRENRP